MENNWNGFITFFGTNDLEETNKFYNEVLGLPLYKDQGVCRIYEVSEGGKIGFCSHIEVLAKKKSPIITLLTDNVDEVYEDLKKAGFEGEEAPQKNPKFNIYHFFVKDPNGYSVEIQKFLD